MGYARKRYGRNGGLVMGRPFFPMNMPRPFGEYVATGAYEEANPFTPSLGDLREQLTSPDVKLGAAMALTYHGYKRTGSILWALAYGMLGRTLPLVAVPMALAQGFGEKKVGC